tara:strand:+ start:5136 stop:6440 length:1305 start_codon:yes stop_codon:yes gene_type:complete
VIAFIPSILVILSCFAIAYATLNLASGFSTAIISGLSTLTLIGLYFCISMAAPKLLKLNNILILNLVLSCAGIELVLRVMADRLPVDLVQMLPPKSQIRLLEARGLFTQTSLEGDGMLYHWRPMQKVKNLPWIQVDENGYRNPQRIREAAIVVLGDSVTIAQNSKRDLAALLRRQGYSSINLGFGGYGPLHYRDAYRRYVIETDIPHRHVVVNFCACNDVNDTQTYTRIVATGGDWQDYLSKTPNRTAFPFSFSPPWTISILFNLPYVVVQSIKDRQAAGSGKIQISLARGKISATGWLFSNVAGETLNRTWQPVRAALGDIVRMANSAKARVIFAYYPDMAQLYLPGLPLGSMERARAEQAYLQYSRRLSNLAREFGADFVDYTPAIRRANDKVLSVESEGDYHPNQIGVEAMFESLLPALNPVAPHPSTTPR